MKRIPRDTRIALLVLGLLLVAIIATTLWQAGRETPLPTLAAFSTQPTGGQALFTWLNQLGYQTGTKMTGTFEPPENADVLFILAPSVSITPDEWERLDEWIDNGGTLVLVGDSLTTIGAFTHFDFILRLSLPEDSLSVEPTPSLASPPLSSLSQAAPQATLSHSRDDVTELAYVDGEPVLLTFTQGDGRVVLSTLPYPLSNAGLKETGNPDLALNIASFAPPGGTIWFDEWHHGMRGGGEDRGLAHWLRSTPAGNALLYAALVTFIALLLNGRRFGRPVPVPQDTARRSPVEHIDAVANLSRRAGHRRPVLEAYHQRLKRDLGRRYRLDPSLPDAEYMKHLAAYDPEIDQEKLSVLLVQLRQSQVSEARLLELAQEVEKLLNG